MTRRKLQTVIWVIGIFLATGCQAGSIRLTGQERPVILEQTSAPTTSVPSLGGVFWGEDPTTGRILIEGQLVQLPAALEAFEDQGWTRGRSLDVLMPRSESVVRMEKNGQQLSLGVINETDQIQDLRDCPVISVRPASSRTGLAMQLTRTLKTGMSSQEAIGFVAPYKPRIREMADLVFYEVIRNHMTIRLVIDPVQEILLSIEYEWQKSFDAPDPVNAMVPG